MKKSTLISLLVIAMMLMFSSCGVLEGLYDGANYESLTNEKVNVEIISGGKVLRTYKNAKVIYSSSDTQSLMIRTSQGVERFIQGDVDIEIL